MMRPATGVFNQQVPSAPTEYRLWSTSAVGTVSADDYEPTVILGTKFRATSNGYIRAILWQKGNTFYSTANVALWSNAGANLSGTISITGLTTTGWKRHDFSSPIAITSGTLYIASVLYPGGSTSGTRPGYSLTAGLFNSALTVGPLVAVATAESINGLYRYNATMLIPNETYQAGGYYIDVVFTYT